jgi:hypothetical protein
VTADWPTVCHLSLMIIPTPIAKCLLFVAVSTQQIACDALITTMWLSLGLVCPTSKLIDKKHCVGVKLCLSCDSLFFFPYTHILKTQQVPCMKKHCVL